MFEKNAPGAPGGIFFGTRGLVAVTLAARDVLKATSIAPPTADSAPLMKVAQTSNYKHRLLAACLSASVAACSPSPAGDAVLPIARGSLAQKNVVLITLDTTRRDHLGCYSKDVANTPNIDSLCRQSVRFDHAVAAAPVTLPAHSSMLTGKYPPAHGARYNGERYLAEQQVTLAEILTAAGYDSAGFVSSFVLDHRFGTAQGFSHYDDTVRGSAAAFDASGNERDAQSVTDAALTWLDGRLVDRPIFLWVHYFDAHAPYRRHGLPEPSDDRVRYSAELSFIDTQLSRLLSRPELSADQALVMLLADHGEGLGEHGERTHGLFIYDSTVAIPWFVRAPGMRSRTTDALVSQVDLFPTVLDALGLDIPTDLDGRSMLDPPRSASEAVYVETTLPYFDFRLSSLHGLRTRTGKYIYAPQDEFYALASDPNELHNKLLDDAPPIEADRLATQLDQLLSDWPKVETDIDATVGRDEEALARLRSLGYLSGTDLGADLRDPKDAVELVDAHMQAAEAASAGRTEDAIAHLGRAIELFPDARSALYLRARLLAASGKAVEAEADVQKINKTQPNADTLLLQAQLWISGKRYDEARELVREARRLDPHHGGTWVVEGDLSIVAGQIDAARAAYQHALALDPSRVGRQARSRLDRLPRRDPIDPQR